MTDSGIPRRLQDRAALGCVGEIAMTARESIRALETAPDALRVGVTGMSDGGGA